MLADHVRAIQRVCFDSKPSSADLERLGSRERWLVYRELVRTRLHGVIAAALPRTKKALGDEAFTRVVAEWLSTGGPTTRYFRHVPNDFAEFAIPIWRDTAEAWLADLGRYEMTSWWVRHAPPNPVPGAELSFESRPVVASAVRVLRLDHPVHDEPPGGETYARRTTLLCLYRNAQHRAVPIALNPLAADLLEAWQRGEESVAESVERIAREHDTPIGPGFIEKLSALIADFVDEGVLLGGRP
jgi:hypothetical protein